jgi:WD40 repeat protein
MRSCPQMLATWLGMAWIATVLAAEPIHIEVPIRTAPVGFTQEIAPLLQANCTACHNQKKAEGGLNLETLSSLLRGGDSGAVVVPGKSTESPLLAITAHQQATIMPPPDNLVGARPLTPTELGLLKLWIDQGAAGADSAREIQWQSPPGGYQPALAAAVTPDGQFAVCSRGHRICIYHLATGKLVAHLVDSAVEDAAHHDIVRSLAFDPAGELLASGGFREVKLWRRPHVTRASQWTHEAAIRSLAASADGRLIAAGDEQGGIRVWQASDGQTIQSFAAHDAAVTGIAFAGTDGSFFSCSLDKSLKGWTATGNPLAAPVVLPEAVESLIAIDHGRQLVTGDQRGLALVWDAASLSKESTAAIKPLVEIKAHGGAVTALAPLDSKPCEFFSGGADGLVRRWDATSSNKLAELKNDAPVVAVAVSSDGRRIAAAGAEMLKLWDESGKLVTPPLGEPRLAAKLAQLDSQITFTKAVIERSDSDLKSYEGLIRITGVTKDAVKAAEDELTKAQKARDEKQAALDKVQSDEKPDKAKIEAAEKALATAETAVTVAGTVIERAKAVSERTASKLDEAQQALSAHKELLQRQELSRTETAAAAKASSPKFRSLAFSHDQRSLATGFDDGAVQFFDAESGTPSQLLAAHRDAATGLAFSAAGTLYTGSADKSALVWNVPQQWKLERVVGGLDCDVLADRVLSVDFSRDGRWLATGGGVPSRSGEVKIFNVADGKLIRELENAHSDTVFAVRFSPIGESLATAAGDRLVKVFDAKSGSELRRFAGHTAHVLALSWKADGKLLVSSGADNVLKLWDLDSGLMVRTMKGGLFGNRTYKGAVTSVAFIGDSEEILAASGDGTLRLHRAASDHEIMTFTGSKGYQHAAAATPDGRAVIATDSEGVMRVWSGHQPQQKLSLTP